MADTVEDLVAILGHMNKNATSRTIDLDVLFLAVEELGKRIKALEDA